MIRLLLVAATFLTLSRATAQTGHQKAPAENPPSLERNVAFRQPAGTPGTLYSIGDPTDDEQLYLELINRARLNPVQEAAIMANHPDPSVQNSVDFFNVNTSALHTAIAALPPVPPLAMNAQLTAAARGHTQDQFDNAFQGHTGTDNSSLGQRATAAGYNWTTLAENVFSFAESAVQGHAGFEIDWGFGPDGMQSPPGHRIAIHNANFREVGIGVINGSNTSGTNTVGPQVVTQDFGREAANTPFITGVAYYDLNGNNFYDLGEGLGGITVTVTGSSFHAVTTGSGGYAVPVSGNGNYTVAFSGTNLTTFQTNITVANNENEKVDFVPVYVPATPTGSAMPSVGQNNTYTFNTVGAATSYDWRSIPVNPFTTVEGAENGTNGLILSLSSGYDPVSTDIRNSGSASFHILQPSPATDQLLQLPQTIRPSASSQLQFASRLRIATADQSINAQVSTNGGISWTTLYSQSGTSTDSESTFTQRSVSLAAFAGQDIHVRFTYEAQPGGTFFPQTAANFGVYLDDIAITAAEELGSETITAIPSGMSFQFNPSGTGEFLLAVRARNLNRVFPFGPELQVAAIVPPQLPVITAQPQSVVTNHGTTINLTVTATSATTPSYQWSRNGSVLNGETGTSLTLANVNRASGGSYTVEVTNTDGSVTSSPAVVRVRVPQTIQIPTFLANDAGLRLLFRDQDNGTLSAGDIPNFRIEFSSDLSTWTLLPGTPTVDSGSLQIDDTAAPQQTWRFYRVREE